MKGHTTPPRGRYCVSEMRRSELFIWERQVGRLVAGDLIGAWVGSMVRGHAPYGE